MSANRPTPIWLAHHWPDEYDRCVLVGRRHICRRCIVMYPIAFAVIALSLAGVALPTPWSQLALVFLPLPALVEFVGEHLGSWRYSATACRRSWPTAPRSSSPEPAAQFSAERLRAPTRAEMPATAE